MTTSKSRAVDLLTSAFDLQQRRQFSIKNDAGDVVLDLYFKPITRSARKHAMSVAGTEDALELSTQMLCQMAELEDGTKAFQAGDAVKLQRELPESVLNEIELFLFGLGEADSIDEAKKS